MKNKRHHKKSNARVTPENRRAIVKSPAPDIAPEPSGPPLAGEALELRVAEVLCVRFREQPDRASLRKKCQGADHAAIEAAIVSPRVRTAVEPVAQAYALEQVIAVLQLLLSGARAALENPKPTAAQIAALKIIFEVLVEKLLEKVWGGVWQEAAAALFSSPFEQSVVENMLQLLRGQKAPATEVPQRTPKRAEDGAMANDHDSDLPGEFGG